MRTIPGYELVQALYSDEDYVLFRGVRDQTDQHAIIKVLRRDIARPNDAALLRHELDLSRSVEHPGVLRGVEVRRTGGSIALLFEDFDAESLRARLERGRIALVTMLEIGVRTARALAAIHRAGVVHKRITPASILVESESSEVRLTDFCAASRLRREQGHAAAAVDLEWLPYVSPEQTGRMNRSIDFRSDLYSLGISFYEMLTGRTPFSSDDVMGLVHCHIARRPRSPHEVAPEIPQPVSEIVMRLLAKRAEDRYQSALGVAADLEHCLDALREHGGVAPFEIGAHDASQRLEIPENLYGREDEVHRLVSAFDRAAGGVAEFVVVAGYSGVGKSALVREVHRPIVARRGYFIAGKFDQFQRDVPYSALIEAFSDMTAQILAEPPDRIDVWRERFRHALGDNAGVIVEMIPEFELIVGECAPLTRLSPTDEQVRFNVVFKRFVQACASEDHPLAVFLDDLQWADLATLQLIRSVGADREMRYVLQIGAYRDNEVELHHPLMLTLADLHKANAPMEEMTLHPLAMPHLRALIADSLHQNTEAVTALTELVHAKTGGNPFFVRQFLEALHEDDLLTRDATRSAWVWDLDRIQAADVTSNVVDLMVRKIRRLPGPTQEALRLASCIGNHFDLHTLMLVREGGQERVASEIWEAVREGLVLPVGEAYRLVSAAATDADETDVDVRITYRFLHDRVQQAAYALIPKNERRELHLRIGRLLAAGLTDAQRDERVFDVVNHLNYGVDLIDDLAERIDLAELNLAAGQKAVTSSAYHPAAEFLRVGIELLPRGAWDSHYELALALHDAACVAEAMRRNFDRMDVVAKAILDKARTPLEKVGVYKLRIQHLCTLGAMRDACDACIDILTLLGHGLPKKPSKFTLMRTISTTKWRLSRTTPAELLELPEMTDPVALAAIDLCAQAGPPAFQGAPELLLLLLSKEVELSLRYGNSISSAHGYGGWAVVLASVSDDCEGAHRYGKLGEDVARRFGDKGQLGRSMMIFNQLGRHWVEPLSRCIQPLVDARTLLAEACDLEHVAYTSYHPGYLSFYGTAERLELVNERFERCIAMLERLGMAQALPMARVGLQATRSMRGLSRDPTSLASDAYDPDAHLDEYAENHHRSALHYIHVMTAMMHYHFDEFGAAVERAEQAEIYVDGVPAMMKVVELNLFQSLSLLAHALEGGIADRKAALRKVTRNQKRMAHWAKSAPVNFAHKHDLVAADVASLRGLHEEAIRLYERASAGARSGEFLQEECIAYERTALHYLRGGRSTAAAAFMQKAAEAYTRWGAMGKVRALREAHPDLLRPSEIVDPMHAPDPGAVGLTSAAPDFALAMRASREISGEIVLEELLPTLLHAMIENAGAVRGELVRVDGAQMTLEADGDARAVRLRDAADASDAADWLPPSIVEDAIRTKAPVVVAAQLRGGGDDSATGGPAACALAVPILTRGEVTGVVRLERDAGSESFSRGSVEAVQMLAAQASISLENARLYGELGRLNHAYERFVPRSFLRLLAKRSIVDVELGDHVERDVSVLFADLASFASLSEGMPANERFAFLNAYLERMEPIVLRHGGFIDKYIGDSIMALFDGAADAPLRAAIEMQDAIGELNADRSDEGLAPIRIGVGINSGPAMLGTIGGHDRMDGTVIGDTVNVASRIEGLTLHMGASILVSQGTVDRLSDAVRAGMRTLGRVRVAGRAKWTTIHEVYRGQAPEVVALREASRADVDAGLACFHARDPAQAATHFRAALARDPEDHPVAFLLRRAESAVDRDLPEDWDGAVTLDTK